MEALTTYHGLTSLKTEAIKWRFHFISLRHTSSIEILLNLFQIF
jgi:hypothetical protein